MTILKDLTQKAYDDCERAISRTMSLLDNDRDKFSLAISIGVNLINHSLDHVDRDGMTILAYNNLVNAIKSRIDNLPDDFDERGN